MTIKTRLTQRRFGINHLALSVVTLAFAAGVGFQSRCVAGDATPPSSAERKAAPPNPFEQAVAATAGTKPATTLNPFEQAAQGAGLNPFELAARGGTTTAEENPFEREARLAREELARQEQEQRRAAEQAAQLAHQDQDAEPAASVAASRGQVPAGLNSSFPGNRAGQSEQSGNSAAWHNYNQAARNYNNGLSVFRPTPPPGVSPVPIVVVIPPPRPAVAPRPLPPLVRPAPLMPPYSPSRR